MTHWLWLIIAAIFEVIWALSIKHLDGLNKVWPITINIISIIIIVVALEIAFKTLPIGIGYAAWKGLAAIGVIVLSVVVYHERIDLWIGTCLALILIGIIGLSLRVTS